MDRQQHPNPNGQLPIAQDIVIVGGGVAGLATALALHRVGVKSIVLERAESLRTEGAAFIMWANAWKALDALGVAHSLRPTYSLLDGIRGWSGVTGVKRDLQLEERHKGGVSLRLESRCIERMRLLEVLAKALPEGSIRFNSKVVSIHKSDNFPFTTLDLADGTSMAAKIVIGCDGVSSIVAKYLSLSPAKSSGRVAIRGMVTYPERHNLEKLRVQVWGNGVRAGFIPCTDKKVYWFLTTASIPQEAKICGDAERIRRMSLEMVKDLPGPIAELIKLSPAETLNLAETKLRWIWPWQWEWEKVSGRGSVIVVGDALHPMTPDLGQGACFALEDAVVLGRCLEEAISNVSMAAWGENDEKTIECCLNKFLQERKWRMCGIVSAAFAIGEVQEGCSKWMRFVRDRIFFPLFSMSYLLYFVRYDCGVLPIPNRTIDNRL